MSFLGPEQPNVIDAAWHDDEELAEFRSFQIRKREQDLRRQRIIASGMSDLLISAALVHVGLLQNAGSSPYNCTELEQMPLSMSTAVVHRFLDSVHQKGPEICAFLLQMQTLDSLLDWFIPPDMRTTFNPRWTLMPCHEWGAGSFKLKWPGQEHVLHHVFLVLYELREAVTHVN